jgi:ubiquinone/menaquinone biosynthesis C-methylase UbiE
VNYDLTDIPAGYDRGRDLTPDVLALWMEALDAHVTGQAVAGILDLGCGTGRFSEALAMHFGARVLGIDPSGKMLEQAFKKRRTGSVHYQRARAEAIPLGSGSVDLIFMSMSFHHFADDLLAARECRRVLRKPGVVFVRTGTRERMDSYPYVPFLPSTRSIIGEMLPDSVSVRKPFEAAGFRMLACDVITQTVAESWEAYATRLEAGGDSVLARLSPGELQSGLTKLRQHGSKAGKQLITEPIDLFVFC